jgi:hypothetical protein
MREKIMRIQETLKNAEVFLSQTQLGKGWGYTILNQQKFIEPSSWCLLFLYKLGNEIDGSLEWLASYQNVDGGWPNIFGGPSDIRTANALIVFNELDTKKDFRAQYEAGVQWLTEHRKRTGGWSWCEESWNFTEPTCLALLALQGTSLLEPSSLRDFVLKFQCTDGGWSCHAPILLGRQQVSTPNVTSWALIALKCLEPSLQCSAVLEGLTYIKRQIIDERLHSPYSLALCLRTLVIYDAEHNVQEIAARRLIQLQRKNGSWSDNILWTSIAGMTLIEYAKIHLNKQSRKD